MNESSIRYQAWVTFLDVYGFSAIVREDSGEAFERLLSSIRQMRAEVARSSPAARIFSFSDSVFLVHPVDSSSEWMYVLHRLYEDIQRIQSIYARANLPLRGGIARGLVNLGNDHVVGEAVLRAYEYEQQLGAPLVLLPQRELFDSPCEEASGAGDAGHSKDLAYREAYEKAATDPFHVLLCHRLQDVTIRDGGIVRAAVICPEDRGAFALLAESKYAYYVQYGPPHVATQWRRAMSALGLLE